MCQLLVDYGRPAQILLVDDNRNDAELAKLGFGQVKLPVNLHHVVNGVECLAFLNKQGQYADVPTPDLVLLDLNMPLMDGFDVLAELNRDGNVPPFPVVVMTTSDREQDIERAYKLGCQSYIVKPMSFDSFVSILQTVSDYWFSVVTLPEKNVARRDAAAIDAAVY